MDAATEAWNRKDAQRCQDLMQQLASDLSEDVKVKANLAAARFVVESQAGKPYASADIKDIFVNATPDSQLSNAASLEEVPNSILLILNSATVLYNANQSVAAAKLLTPVWHAIEKKPISPGISEGAILGVCFLLIAANFSCKHYARVAAILTWLERKYDLASDDKEDGDSKVSGIDNASSIHSGEFSQQASPGSPQTSDQVSQSVSGFNVAQLLLNWNARLHLVTGNLRAAKREIRSLLALDLSNSQAISLKAELEARRGNLRRAGKLVTARASDSGSLPGLDEVQMLCNMAFVQHAEGKHHAAVLCYSRALKISSQSRLALTQMIEGEEVRASSANISNAEASILYSCGMQALLLKQHESAYDYFQKCAASMFRDPLLWLRMCQCCVGAFLSKHPLRSLHSDTEGFAGEQNTTDRKQDTVPQLDNVTRTLLHGKQCAANAVYLYQLSSTHRKDPQDQGGINGLGRYSEESTLADEPMLRSIEAYQKRASQAGKMNALSMGAYICLQLDHAASALQYALDILSEAEKGSQEWQFGKAYASEALQMLGKPGEAAEHLQSAFEAIIEASSQDQQGAELAKNLDNEEANGRLNALSPEALHSFKVALLVNLASTYFSSGDMTQAAEFAQEGAADDENRDAVLTSAYMRLCLGDTTAALNQLRAFQLGVST